MKKHIHFLTFVFLLLSGCSQQSIILILRDVPVNPSFIVIPPNDLITEVHFANHVEEALINSGVKVIRRPIEKSDPAKKSIGNNTEIKKDAADQPVSSSVIFRDISEFTSDYLIETFSENQQVKFTNCATRQVVSIINLEKNSYDQGDASDQMIAVQEVAKKILSQSKTNRQTTSPAKK